MVNVFIIGVLTASLNPLHETQNHFANPIGSKVRRALNRNLTSSPRPMQEPET